MEGSHTCSSTNAVLLLRWWCAAASCKMRMLDNWPWLIRVGSNGSVQENQSIVLGKVMAMGWWNDEGPKCSRCFEPTAGCEDCKGEGSIAGLLDRIECSTCGGTGWVCKENNHGKYWT